jgi:c-di-GMP-binding flagellar brake protein YcgR
MQDQDMDMQDRYSTRVPIEGSAIFAGESMVGEGRIIDLSLPGCLLESPDSIRVGDYIRLKLFLPDDQPAVSVPLAAVRWAKDGRLGLEFIRSSEEDQARLQQLVQRHREEDLISEWEWQG